MDRWLRDRLMTVRETHGGDGRELGVYRDLLAQNDALRRRVRELEENVAQRCIDEAFKHV